MNVLLDTSVCIAVMRGHRNALNRLSRLTLGDCFISTIAVSELYAGVIKAQDSSREVARVERLLSSLRVADFDQKAAWSAAQVRAQLEAIGRKCGPNDTLIAGHALALNLPLATNNVREFSRVSGLQVQDWLA